MGNKKIYVGNLPFSTTDEDLRGLFKEYSAVASVKVIVDRDTGRSRGFAFVEFVDSSSLDRVVRSLNGFEFQGRRLRVNEAQERRGSRRLGELQASGTHGSGDGEED